MNSTQASSSNPSKKIKLTIIPPRQLLVNICSDEDVTTTPSPTTTSSSPFPPNAPSKTLSTNQISSSQENTSSSSQSSEIVHSAKEAKKFCMVQGEVDFESLKFLQLQLFRSLEDWEISSLQFMQCSQEYMNDLEEEYQARALLAKSKRFFKKGIQRFSSAKETDQTECHKCGKKGHFVRDCSSKASVPSYQSPFQPKLLHSSEHKPELRHTKDFEASTTKSKLN
ncbi:hypothetical protein Tco_1282191 [Tanacetum coccineum]